MRWAGTFDRCGVSPLLLQEIYPDIHKGYGERCVRVYQNMSCIRNTVYLTRGCFHIPADSMEDVVGLVIDHALIYTAGCDFVLEDCGMAGSKQGASARNVPGSVQEAEIARRMFVFGYVRTMRLPELVIDSPGGRLVLDLARMNIY